MQSYNNTIVASLDKNIIIAWDTGEKLHKSDKPLLNSIVIKHLQKYIQCNVKHNSQWEFKL